jgi:hypothetical protein
MSKTNTVGTKKSGKSVKTPAVELTPGGYFAGTFRREDAHRIAVYAEQAKHSDNGIGTRRGAGREGKDGWGQAVGSKSHALNAAIVRLADAGSPITVGAVVTTAAEGDGRIDPAKNNAASHLRHLSMQLVVAPVVGSRGVYMLTPGGRAEWGGQAPAKKGRKGGRKGK